MSDEYLRLKEIVLATIIKYKPNPDVEDMPDAQRRAVFANIASGGSGGGDKDISWKDDDYKITAIHKEPIVSDYFGIGMMKEHSVGVSKDKIEDGEHAGKYGVQDNITKELHFLDTKDDAKNKAREMAMKLPEKYRYARDIIKSNGKEMAAKYDGKDIYGNSVKAGDKIIFLFRKIIEGMKKTAAEPRPWI